MKARRADGHLVQHAYVKADNKEHTAALRTGRPVLGACAVAGVASPFRFLCKGWLIRASVSESSSCSVAALRFWPESRSLPPACPSSAAGHSPCKPQSTHWRCSACATPLLLYRGRRQGNTPRHIHRSRCQSRCSKSCCTPPPVSEHCGACGALSRTLHA